MILIERKTRERYPQAANQAKLSNLTVATFTILQPLPFTMQHHCYVSPMNPLRTA